jgi:S-adenosylmethionine:tRNA ribosyltransferase-isomerase
MRVDLFDYELPPERIALAPAEPRDSARLLVVPPSGPFRDLHVTDLPGLLKAGDVVVVNDTRVVNARLNGTRQRGDAVAHVEATLVKRVDSCRWDALVRPAKRLNVGERVRFGESSEARACLLGSLDAEVESKGEGGEVRFRFDLAGAALDDALDAIGEPPLPPYIADRRAIGDRDRTDYQTMFASGAPNAVAAPTAGLHFTPTLASALESAGVRIARVTLHVGAGTFLPVKAEDTNDHRMHSEWGRVDAATVETIAEARKAGRRVVAVGTTSLRILETAGREDGTVAPFAGETSIFITPGYRFKVVDALVTNFHLPRSTLLMLVSAFSGLDRTRAAYKHALDHGYRFYSYGDACFLERA